EIRAEVRGGEEASLGVGRRRPEAARPCEEASGGSGGDEIPEGPEGEARRAPGRSRGAGTGPCLLSRWRRREDGRPALRVPNGSADGLDPSRGHGGAGESAPAVRSDPWGRDATLRALGREGAWGVPRPENSRHDDRRPGPGDRRRATRPSAPSRHDVVEEDQRPRAEDGPECGPRRGEGRVYRECPRPSVQGGAESARRPRRRDREPRA